LKILEFKLISNVLKLTMTENNGFLMQIDEEKNGKRQRFLFLSI